VGEVSVFQIEQGSGNDKGEDLAWLEGSAWIYMEIGADRADIPENALTLERGVGIGMTGMIGHREGDRNAVKPSSIQRGGHKPFSKMI
jgi:hypothetical protein